MDAPAHFLEDYPMADGANQRCSYLIQMQGNVAKCKISWMRDTIKVVSGDCLPCPDEHRAQYAQDLENTIILGGCPLFIFKDCPRCKVRSVMAQAIDLGCDKSAKILACLLTKFSACNLDAAQLLDDPILSILHDERSIDLPENRLSMTAACKLVCLMEAATGGRGRHPFNVGTWVCEILSNAATIPGSILGFLGLLEITIQLFYGEKAAQHRKIESRLVWGAILQILWQHPRVAKGTMGSVVLMTEKLLHIERQLLDEERKAAKYGMNQVPSFSRIQFEIQDQSGRTEITDLLRFCEWQPQRIPLLADLQPTDDIDVEIRELWTPETPLDRVSCGAFREAVVGHLKDELTNPVSGQNDKDVSKTSAATDLDVQGE
ncbi:hypothetical protein CkaCkLH20_06602 [Colletotrichum karsti]|uniref:Uncharacterized protein n=1 Tax=Colletotrichum karsti TaxID=1095194 RepID=A0A9P6I912_9PEZI|nr:uncharacterized protein CkaCkLH20_06602 [Colletotrichum karsti]KAF9876156.1 hypothetical protein CkaCkLH20_06602 [Colletotrichum karsti]